MNKRNLLRASFLSALMCISLAYTSCGDDEAVKPIDSTEYVKTSNIVDYVNNSADEVVTVNVDFRGYNHPVVMEELGKIEGKKVKLVIPEGVHKLHLLEEGHNAPETILPALVSVEFPQSITEISLYAFGGCTGLTSVTIPENVVIGKGAFYGCTGLTSVTIPEGVTEIGVAAFEGCTGLASITIPAGVTEIGVSAFAGCSGLTSVTIPESVTEIGSAAFEGCTGLASITIPAGVSKVDWGTFYGCTGLTNITLSKGVTKIHEKAFYGCSSLANVNIPEGVVEIREYAFEGCSALASITLPESVTELGKFLTMKDDFFNIINYHSAFLDCDNLETIYCSQAIYDNYHEEYPQMVVKK